MRRCRSLVGVDIGKSWLRAALLRPPSRKIRRARRPVSSALCAADALRGVLRSWGIRRADRLVAGSTGVWTAGTRRRLKRQLAPLARDTKVLSDLELAFKAGLGRHPGVLLICGTGSVAYGQDACGHKTRCGGLGQLLGDEGSAFWIGKQWLKGREDLALKFAHRPDALRAVAGLARKVLKEAPRDPKARRILRMAWLELASLAERTARRLHLREPIALCLCGGTFRDPAFVSGFKRRLKGGRWRFVAPAMAPEVAAAKFDTIGR